ncbi:Excision repair cross-complementation group 1, partial [Haplosporangium bisporale]
ISGFAANATKPATAHSSSGSSAMRTPQASSDSSQASGIARPGIYSSQQKQQQPQQQQLQQPQQQQQHHPSQPRRTSIGRSKATTSSAQDDEFGFDDLDDLDFHDDDFFNLEDDAPAKLTTGLVPVPTTTATPTTASSSSTPSSSAATPTTGSSAPSTATATPPFIPKSKSAIVIRTSQRGNPLLQFIRNVPYEYGDIVPDYAVGFTSCILFLSIRYHRLHPEYIFSRIADLGKSYVLRVILILVDV